MLGGSALVLFSAVVVAGALAASTNFVEPASSPERAGSNPRSLVAADLDGDTDQDLAVVNRAAGTVTILRNGGAGNFHRPAWSPETVGDGPFSLAVADLDGDADQDLAVANRRSNSVTILLNRGRGNFGEPASSPEAARNEPAAIVAADFNGDTRQDLAVANFQSSGVSVFRNRGAGNFRQFASGPEATGTGPTALAAADLDGDTDQDLAVANALSGDVTVLRNSGVGDFNQPAWSPESSGAFPSSVVAADLDGDADQDLAVANNDSDDVTILRNGGAGNFNRPGSSPEAVGDFPTAVAAADFDLDGDQDLAVANGGSDNVTILRNGGAGNFNRPRSSPETVGDFPTWVGAADLDGDNDQDLAVANTLSSGVTILRNR